MVCEVEVEPDKWEDSAKEKNMMLPLTTPSRRKVGRGSQRSPSAFSCEVPQGAGVARHRHRDHHEDPREKNSKCAVLGEKGTLDCDTNKNLWVRQADTAKFFVHGCDANEGIEGRTRLVGPGEGRIRKQG